jgi:hypothetical protein
MSGAGALNRWLSSVEARMTLAAVHHVVPWPRSFVRGACLSRDSPCASRTAVSPGDRPTRPVS